MRYFTFLSHAKSSKPILHFGLIVHLKQDLPHFKCSVATVATD